MSIPNRGYACVGLDNPKHSVNVGSALRACGVFDASMIAVSGNENSVLVQAYNPCADKEVHNLAATVNVVLYDRMLKRMQKALDAMEGNCHEG